MTRDYKGFFMGCPVIRDTSMKPGEWRLGEKSGVKVIYSNPPKI